MLNNVKPMNYFNFKNIIIKLISKYLGGFISIIWLICGLLMLMQDAYDLSFFIILSLIISFSFFRNIFKPYKITIIVEFLAALYYSCKHITFFWFSYPYFLEHQNLDNPALYLSNEFFINVAAPYIKKTFSDQVSIFFDAVIKNPIPMITFYFLTITFYLIRFFSIKIVYPVTNPFSK